MNLCGALNVTSEAEFQRVLDAAPAHLREPLTDARTACRLVEQEQIVTVRTAAARVVESVKRWHNGELVEEVERVLEERAP